MKSYKDHENNHDKFNKDHVKVFLRNHRTGTDNFGRAFLANYISQKGECSVIDVAGGTGVNWEVMVRAGCKDRVDYTLYDLTGQFLDHAKELYGDNISCLSGHCQDIPLEDNSKDVVILRHIIEHLPDGYERTIQEALRVAKKEVILVLFEPLTNSSEDVFREEDDTERDCTYFWNFYSKSKMEGFLSGLGVEVEYGISLPTPGAAHADHFIYLKKHNV